MKLSHALSARLLPAVLLATGAAGVQGQTGTVVGTVYDSIAHEPLADAAVFLWDTPYQGVSDSLGSFEIADVPPGDYSVLFFHTRLGEMGASVGPLRISVGAGERVRVGLATPSMFTLVASGCLMEDYRPGTGIVAGWVGDADSGLGLPGAEVTLSWNVADSPYPDRLNLATNTDGWYRACDAPSDVPMSAMVRFLNRQGYRREVSVPTHGMAEAGFLLYELKPTFIQGTLVDAVSSTPVTDAVVWLRGTSIRSVTDQQGHFQFRDVPPGSYMLMSEHLAYGTKMDTLEVPGGQRLAVRMALHTEAIEIAPLTVSVAEMPIPDRARGGIHISAADVESVRQRSRDAVDVLRALHIPGVVIRQRNNGSICVGYAPGQARMMFDSGCVPMVIFLNDARSSNNDMALQLPPDAIERMVIYKPVEAGNLFGLGSGNGILVIYTKGNGIR